jgi:hypothetical protein
MPTKLHDVSLPNVWAFAWFVDDDPVPWAVYRAVPGSTKPRIQHGEHDYGRVASPTRFGRWGSTKEAFRGWAQRFADDVQQRPLAGATVGDEEETA